MHKTHHKRRRQPAKRACIVFTCTNCDAIVPVGQFISKGCPKCGNRTLRGRAVSRKTQERIAKWSSRKWQQGGGARG